MSTEHPLYQLCYSAHYNTSFSPDKRALSEITFYEDVLKEFKEKCGEELERFEKLKNKFHSLFTAHMHAKSRCLSSMITGPARFPVARAEKARNSEHKRGAEVLEFLEKVRKTFHKEEHPSAVISSDDEHAVEKLTNKIEAAKRNHEIMKFCNNILRDKKLSEVDKRTELLKLLKNEKQVDEISDPKQFGGPGFASFSLTNNLADIKRMEQRLKELKAREGKENKEELIKGVRCLHNYTDNRLQLFFDGKPSPDTISKLKSRGFKWSPTNQAWQRMLNGNAIWAAKVFFQEYQN